MTDSRDEHEITPIDPASSLAASHTSESMQLLRRAIVEGWQIPPEIMSAAPKIAARILLEGTSREKLRAMDVLNRMRDSNIQAMLALDKVDRLNDGSPTEIVTLGKIVL